MRPRRSAVFLSLALAASAPAGATGQALTTPWVPTADERQLAEAMIALLEAARADSGIAPLARHPNLDLLAYQHSREMAERGRISHHSYRFGVSTRSRIRLAFPRIFQFAENVARNRSPEALHDALMSSRGHRLNRMDPSFTHVGLGVVRASANEMYVTEVFVRATTPSQLQLHLLYTTADPALLPRDEPTHGEIAAETITIGRPDDDDPAHLTALGIEAFQRGDFDEAVRRFRQALRARPEYEFARFNLGRALLRAGSSDEALTVLEAFVGDHDDDLDAWRTLGTAALVCQRYGRAEQAFRRVLSSGARDAGAWYNLGLSIEYQDRPEEAERAYAQALHLDPDLEPARVALRRVRR